MFCNEETQLLNEGLNDRFAETYKQNLNITSDVHVDEILSRTPLDKIWFGSDWHLFKYDKEHKKIEKNPDAEAIIRGYEDVIEDDGVFIFLGDLNDDECQNYQEVSNLLRGRLNKGYKIFILGNNDLQPESYYTDELGFDTVFEGYQWGKFTFTHLPAKKFNTQYNIHGHMHHWWDYNYEGVTYNNMIKIYTKEYHNKPVSFKEVIEKYNKGYYTDKVNK